MVEIVALTAGTARLELVPEMGGGIARLDVDGRPVLRPFGGDAKNPFSLGCNVLVPFSNRISKGGFFWNGTFHEISPNLAGETFPIHGDGFQKPWTLSQDDGRVQMRLADGCIGPWRYTARQTFSLTETEVTLTLDVSNSGDCALPFGGGFHPWFPRTSRTRLAFTAGSVWTENDVYLPLEERPIDQLPNWDFSTARALPSGWINNAFCGWDRRALILQGDQAVSCSVMSSKSLGTALVYSPSVQADFFCFEPVSHPVDACHLPGAPGLHVLEPGEIWHAGMTIDWESVEGV